MSADSEAYPPPNEPAAFESLCLDLWKEIWEDPGAQKNGRSGQSQAGKVHLREIGPSPFRPVQLLIFKRLALKENVSAVFVLDLDHCCCAPVLCPLAGLR